MKDVVGESVIPRTQAHLGLHQGTRSSRSTRQEGYNLR
ncbi:unnamed protein product [Brassica rapa subsp. trilocularis]